MFPFFVACSLIVIEQLGFQKMVPNYKTMFSCLRHYPRNYVTLDSTDPIPPHLDRQWRGYADQARENLVTYKT